MNDYIVASNSQPSLGNQPVVVQRKGITAGV